MIKALFIGLFSLLFLCQMSTAAAQQQLDGGYRVVMIITVMKADTDPFIESKMSTDTFLTLGQCQSVAKDRAVTELQLVKSVIAGRQMVANINFKCSQNDEIFQIGGIVDQIHAKFGWAGK